jgi:hypothetical protein
VSHYEVLGVAPAADEVALRQAYVALARQHHPDVAGGDAARMRAINEAWATLGDPVRRARYDRSLHLGAAPATVPSRPAEDLRDGWGAVDDLDDRPVHGAVRLPRWLSLLPVGLFAASVALFVVGLVLASEPVIALAGMAFALSCLFFLAAPFIALFASRRPGGHPNE